MGIIMGAQKERFENKLAGTRYNIFCEGYFNFLI